LLDGFTQGFQVGLLVLEGAGFVEQLAAGKVLVHDSWRQKRERQ